MNNSFKFNPPSEDADKQTQVEVQLKEENETKMQPYFEGANFKPCSFLRTIVKDSPTDMNLYKLFTNRHLML